MAKKLQLEKNITICILHFSSFSLPFLLFDYKKGVQCSTNTLISCNILLTYVQIVSYYLQDKTSFLTQYITLNNRFFFNLLVDSIDQKIYQLILFLSHFECSESNQF